MKTIIDVAQLAGVSKSTVSRVIRDSGSVKEETRRKVEAAMNNLNYVPNQLAQGIRTGHSRTIAMMVSETSNLYYNELLYHIEAIARANDYMVLFCNCGNSPIAANKYITWLRQRNVDGLLYCFYRDNAITDAIYRLAEQLPVVFLDNPLGNRSGISYVGSDGLSDIAGIVRYLNKTGARRIAFLGIADIANVMYRLMGYRAGLVACGYEYDPDLIYIASIEEPTNSHFMIGYQGAKHLMESNHAPDAIVCATDMLAIGAMRYLQEKSLSIPKDVSVTGYDDIPLSAMCSPALSTVRQSVSQIAEAAMSILIHKIEIDNSMNRNYTASSIFVPRASTRLE